MLTAIEVAKKLSVKPRTVRDWLHAGKIPGVVLPDGSLRFNEYAIEEWIKARTIKIRPYTNYRTVSRPGTSPEGHQAGALQNTLNEAI